MAGTIAFLLVGRLLERVLIASATSIHERAHGHAHRFNMKMEVLDAANMKSELAAYLARNPHIKFVLLGVRDVDPTGGTHAAQRCSIESLASPDTTASSTQLYGSWYAGLLAE